MKKITRKALLTAKAYRPGKASGGYAYGGSIGDDDEIHVYHSSPHDFDQFSTDFIGKGEGNQAYGHGLYFAEAPEVSGQGGRYWSQFWNKMKSGPEQSAATALSANNFNREKAADYLDRSAAYHLEHATKNYGYEPDIIEGHRQLHTNYSDAAEMLRSGKIVGPRTYEAGIKAKPEHFWDWDAPISDQHEKVLNALAPFFPTGIPQKNQYGTPLMGGDIYRQVVDRAGGAMFKHVIDKAGIDERVPGGTPERLSRYMLKMGVPGIRYYDAGSRVYKGGSRNHVVFDPKIVNVKKKYEYGGMAGSGYADGGSTGKLPERVVNFKNFYSRGAEAARQLSQKKGSPQQMRAMLEKAGVKPEEFAQSGFDEAFSGKPSVTSEELFQHFYSKMPNIGVDKLLSEDHSSYDASDPDAEQPAQFEDYTLPGSVNYREHLLKIPETSYSFREQKHWPGHKNVVAHIRMGDRIEPPDLEAHDRTVEKMLSDPSLTQSLGTEPANWGSGAADLALSKGTITKEEAQNLSRAKGWRNNVMKGYKAPRALHVEEIQSDWAQAGRKHGFQDLSADGPSDPDKPPQGPFVNSTQGWTSLALKHALTEAVNGGYNKLVLSPGQANADMYGLDGEQGSGMKSFYDQILPTQMNKLAKSLDPDHPGVQMFSHDLPADYTRDEGYKGHALEITDGMRDAVKKGLPMYKDGGEVEGEGDGDTPAQNAADHIASLLREDRAKEVTDDLMGQADPKRLHEHYESGNTGMQMPMDEDSRMDRAKALGFDVKAYRGQTGDPGASLNTVRTEGKTAGTGSWATSDPDIAATYSGRENPVSIPMMIKSGGYQAHDFGGRFWGDSPEGKTTDELARSSSAPGVHFKNITDVGPHLWNRANVQKRIPETADSFAIKDPKTVRSMFARFDPRLAHLSHLSAATGGAISEKASGGGVNRHLVSSTNPMVHKAMALARNLTRR